jgi:hypothetical protein
MEKQNIDQTEKAKDILKRRSSEIKEKYSVNQMGIGYKMENGKLTNKVALIFYVKKKKTKEELLSEGITPMPTEIDGIPTDIVAVPGGFKPR